MISRFKKLISQEAYSRETKDMGSVTINILENTLGVISDIGGFVLEWLAKGIFYAVIVPIGVILGTVIFGPLYLFEKLIDAIRDKVTEIRLNNLLKNNAHHAELVADFLKPEVFGEDINYKNYDDRLFSFDDYADLGFNSYGVIKRETALSNLAAHVSVGRFVPVWLDVMVERNKIDKTAIVALKQKVQLIKNQQNDYWDTRVPPLVPVILSADERKKLLFSARSHMNYYMDFYRARQDYLYNKIVRYQLITLVTGILLIPLFFTIPTLLKLKKQTQQEKNLLESTTELVTNQREVKLTQSGVLWQLGKLYLDHDKSAAFQSFSKITSDSRLYSAALAKCAILINEDDKLDLTKLSNSFLWAMGNDALGKNPKVAFKCFSNISESHKLYSVAMLHCSYLLRENNHFAAADEYLKKSKDKKILFVQNVINNNPDHTMQDIYRELRTHAPDFNEEKIVPVNNNSTGKIKYNPSVKGLEEEDEYDYNDPKYKLEPPLPSTTSSYGPSFS